MTTATDDSPPASQLDIHALMAAIREAAAPERMLPKSAVLDMSGLGNTELWRMLERGEFPAPRLRTPTRLGWLESEVVAWIRSRPLAPKLPSPNKAATAAQ